MRYYKYFSFLLIAIAIASCGEGITVRDKGKQKTHQSYTKNQIDKNINQLKDRPWSKADYENILNEQIPQLKKASEKTAAKSSLDNAYTEVMISDANKILNGQCVQANAHTTLNAIMTELKKFNNVSGYDKYDKLVSLKKDHDAAASVASKGAGTQTVNSYRDYYDFSAENKLKQEAKTWLGKGEVKCKTTKDKLQKMTQDSYYQGRRQAFCKAIVSYYNQCRNGSAAERNEALARINKAKVNNASTYENAIYSHYEELNNANK